MKNLSILLFLGISFVLLMSFNDAKSPENSWPELVVKELDRRLMEYELERKKSCLASIVKEAEMYVDSIIIDEINTRIMDTIVFPDRPAPAPPVENIRLDDSTLLEIPLHERKK